jgi:hypothetical protein
VINRDFSTPLDISPRLVRGFLFAVTFREHWAIARKSEQFYSVAALYVLFNYSNQSRGFSPVQLIIVTRRNALAITRSDQPRHVKWTHSLP